MMTQQELAVLLCKKDTGAEETNVAQMNEHVKDFKELLLGPRGMEILRMLLMSLALVVITGCGMIPSDFKATLDKGIKDNGAGNYYLACQLGKDGKQVLGVRSELECTADMLQLTGCHKQGLEFEGPR